MWIKTIIKKIIFRSKADSATYINHLRSIGMTVGDRVTIYEPTSVCIDETRPFLVNIGNDVKITRGITILTHGYDWSVLAGMHDVVLGSAGGVTIGNNVFLGMNTTILKGVHIGNNVIIGADSLVNKDVPDNCVAAGNPCKYIMSIDEYYNKRKGQQLAEAFEIYEKYVEKFGTEPKQEIFDEFFFLFHRREDELPPAFERQMKWHDRFAETLNELKHSQPMFDGYDRFLQAAREYREKNRTQGSLKEGSTDEEARRPG